MKDNILKELFKLTDKAYKNDEFPVAAIIYDDNYNIVSKGYNKRNKSNITTDHAEIIAINKANKKTNSWRLNELSMIVSLEPCDMCKTVIKEARLKRVYYVIPRLEYKKQYKNANIKIYKNDNKKIDKYIEKYNDKISSFFSEKR